MIDFVDPNPAATTCTTAHIDGRGTCASCRALQAEQEHCLAKDYAAFLRVIKRIQETTTDPDACPEPLHGQVSQFGPCTEIVIDGTDEETMTLGSDGYFAEAPAALVNGGDIQGWIDKRKAAEAAEDQAMAERRERWEREQLENLKKKYEDGNGSDHCDEEIPF